jgi:hypothetical protein
MQAFNRRAFMTRVALGAAALATAGRALADPDARTAARDGCANCRFYTPTPGATTGTCAFAGKTVSADDGCGEFTPNSLGSTGRANAARP